MNQPTRHTDSTYAPPSSVASSSVEGAEHAVPIGAVSRVCRFCNTRLTQSFVDLGVSPLCESFVERERLNEPEVFYPLHAFVCDHCFLVQLDEYVSGREIFEEYAYFSSYSESWLQHARTYVEAMIERFDLGPHSSVVELASNDGYLLRNFVERAIPALGIEPARNVARVAVAHGVPTRVAFFGRDLAEQLRGEGQRADLLVANNVLAHVPDLNDFVAGIKVLLATRGVLTVEFPHLQRLVEQNQFDTIYHEHFCYFSLHTVKLVLAAHGLTVFDVEQLPTHGGSLRIYARHAERRALPVSPRVAELHARELDAGFGRLEAYRGFDQRVAATKRRLLDFLIEAKDQGRSVVGYGAPGKGNTLLNYCGIRSDLLEYTVDRNPYKQGKFLPGTRIPVHAPQRIDDTRPDYLLILPWNLAGEIKRQMEHVRTWGCRFVLPIPTLTVE